MCIYMAETTQEEEKPNYIDRSYAALPPKDKKAVDVVAGFYRSLATDAGLQPEHVDLIVDLVRNDAIEEMKRRIADKATG